MTQYAWGDPNDQWHQPNFGNGPQVKGSTYTTAIPGADVYAKASAAATAAYNKALATINQRRTDLLHSYGYLGDIDPSAGTVKNVRVDPLNQYGQFQMLLRQQALEDKSAQGEAEDRGLHGGIANQAASELKFTHGGQAAQLGQALTGSLSDLQQEQDQAGFDRDQALYNAELQQLQDALDAGAFDPPIDDSGFGVDDGSGDTGDASGVPPGYADFSGLNNLSMADWIANSVEFHPEIAKAIAERYAKATGATLPKTISVKGSPVKNATIIGKPRPRPAPKHAPRPAHAPKPAPQRPAHAPKPAPRPAPAPKITKTAVVTKVIGKARPK